MNELLDWNNVCGVTNGYVVHEPWLAGDLTESDSKLKPFKLGPASCRDIRGPDWRSVFGDKTIVSFVSKAFGVD